MAKKKQKKQLKHPSLLVATPLWRPRRATSNARCGRPLSLDLGRTGARAQWRVRWVELAARRHALLQLDKRIKRLPSGRGVRMHRLEVHLQGWRAVHLYARLPEDFLPAIPISSAAHPNGCSLPRWRMERNRVCVIVCVDASRESPVVRRKSCGQAQGQRAPLISGLVDVV